MARLMFAMLISFALAAPAAAQTINIDYHDGAGVPSSDYGAAGEPGVWNLLGVAPGVLQPLVDVTGRATSILVVQNGASNTTSTPQQTTTRGDSALLRDYIYSGTSADPIVIDLLGLPDGTYELLTYTMCRQDFQHPSTVWVMDDPSTAMVVSDNWSGKLELGATHARHVVNVTSGILRVTSVNDSDPIVNGLQLRPLCQDACAADVDDDGTVDVNDLLAVVGWWGVCPANVECAGDVVCDLTVDTDDLLEVLGAWGSCGG